MRLSNALVTAVVRKDLRIQRTAVIPGRPLVWRPPIRLVGLLERRTLRPA